MKRCNQCPYKGEGRTQALVNLDVARHKMRVHKLRRDPNQRRLEVLA